MFFERIKNLWKLSELELPLGDKISNDGQNSIINYLVKPKKAVFIKRQQKDPIQSFLEEAHKES